MNLSSYFGVVKPNEPFRTMLVSMLTNTLGTPKLKAKMLRMSR